MTDASQGTYEALARKYRPQSFADVVAQKHVVAALSNALSTGRLHHAYLLTGTRGIGKTTLARILAKCLLCEQGVSATPCGVCEACRQVTAGSHPDVMEIDAASRTGVEDTRLLLENTMYQPVAGRFKIYIIDEVHMLSTGSFNALLKTLEEPPGYVKFILATTDPQKIPDTVVSRCLQFSLKALTREQIATRIRDIATRENLSFDERGVELLARAANGSMRDALSLCDQAIALGGGRIAGEQVAEMLGTSVFGYSNTLLRMLLPGSTLKPEDVLEQLHAYCPDYKNLLEELAGAFHDVALCQLMGPNRHELFDLPNEDLQLYAQNFTPEQLQTYYQIALQALEELRVSGEGRMVCDMAVLRLLVFTPEKKAVG